MQKERLNKEEVHQRMTKTVALIKAYRRDFGCKTLPSQRYLAKCLGLKSTSGIGKILEDIQRNGLLDSPKPDELQLHDLIALVAQLRANGVSHHAIESAVEVGWQRAA